MSSNEFVVGSTTETGVIADLAEAANDARQTTIRAGFEEVGLPVHQTVARDGERIDTATHEDTLPDPFRPRGTTAVSTVGSFVALTNRLGDHNSIAFADPAGKVTAVLNYDGGWGDHRVTYAPTASPEWKAWRSRDGQMMPQREFAEHLQDLRHTIIDPAAADIVQIARTFSATRTAQFESGVRLESGDVQFSYVQETRAQSGPKGGTVQVPEEITLLVPVFRDSSGPTTVTVEFRYDASERGLLLGYRIIQREDVEEAAWQDVVDQVRTGLVGDIDLLDGPAPESVKALR